MSNYYSYDSYGYDNEYRKRYKNERHQFETATTQQPHNNNDGDDSQSDSGSDTMTPVSSATNTAQEEFMTVITSMCKFIPLRLSVEERLHLAILESSLNVSEYTDKVDIINYRVPKHDRIVDQIEEFFRILSGLLCAADFRSGTKMIESRTFDDNSETIRQICEVGRRNKVMNPDKMRTTYGKLMWLLQDAVTNEVSRTIGFSCKQDITTVLGWLDGKNGSVLIADPDLHVATQQLPPRADNETINRLTREKAAAFQNLRTKFVSDTLTEEELTRVVLSIDDYRCFLLTNQEPVDRMIEYLRTCFRHDSDKPESLAIAPGVGGSCLRHSHKEQFVFVLQSMVLWREIMGEMYRLWWLADSDMLNPHNHYRLRDTGQGLNRMQSCPGVGSAMHNILGRVKSRVGSWVGLSVVHLGDDDVPNALVFIDKYTQVPRILAPIVNTLDQIDGLMSDAHMASMINSHFGGPKNLKLEILGDFFRHGFDGSGDDGGSCIDGRLTSAWNWCSLLDKKRYYHVFLLTGFTGFDGETN